MAKTIIRETIIILLLCLAIILVLGVVLYNYVPSNKIVPQEVSYTQTEEVKKAIQESADAENSQVILTYKIDETDLNNYEKQGDYNSGKANPFSSYQQEDVNTTEDNNQTAGNQTTTNSSTSTSSNTNGNSVTENNTTKTNTTKTNTTENKTLFPDTGTK